MFKLYNIYWAFSSLHCRTPLDPAITLLLNYINSPSVFCFDPHTVSYSYTGIRLQFLGISVVTMFVSAKWPARRYSH